MLDSALAGVYTAAISRTEWTDRLKLIKDEDRAFFQPMWRRLLIVLFTSAWTIWEWVFNQDAFWGVLTGAVAAYCIWTFLVTWTDVEPAGEAKKDE